MFLGLPGDEIFFSSDGLGYLILNVRMSLSTLLHSTSRLTILSS
jgi:hypothetical protein